MRLRHIHVLFDQNRTVITNCRCNWCSRDMMLYCIEQDGFQPVMEWKQRRLAVLICHLCLLQQKKKKRALENLDAPIDSSKVCMRDLIYMNPVNNPMKKWVCLLSIICLLSVFLLVLLLLCLFSTTVYSLYINWCCGGLVQGLCTVTRVWRGSNPHTLHDRWALKAI